MTRTGLRELVSGWRPRSLSATLVASTVVLFLLITLATGAATVLFTRDYLTGQLDQDLVGWANNQGREDHEGPPGRNSIIRLPGRNALLVGLSGGNVANDSFNRPLNVVTNTKGEYTTLSASQVASLVDAGIGPAPRTVNLGGDTGSFRAVSVYSSGLTLIWGLPTKDVDRVVNRLFLLLAGGTLIGLVLVTAGGTYVIRRNLAPLERVASTARRVAGLKLDSGAVALAERVSPADTDPRTEVGQVGLALNTMLDNVEGALNARQESEMRVRQFVADASHELRTPLASIRGYAELSRREKDPVPAGVTHAMGRVESEAQRMTSLVEDLLLLARLDEGRPLEQEEVDLTMLAVDAVSDAHAASSDHHWQLDVPEEPITVVGDRARLHQVLTNLLANARVHTPVGTSVVTTLRHEGDQVRMSVTDNGPGIPEALQDKVFERFTRGDDARARTTGSTGLGLSIVSAVGAAHGGRVEVESRPGRTSFSVLLPA
jgi:two-component system OmpR family sensor kinase